jgi:hypothetical protein
MNKSVLAVAALVGGMIVVGCEKSDQPAATPPSTSSSSTSVTVGVTTATVDTSKGTASVTTGDQTATADAQSTLDKIQQYIKDKKFDDADKALKTLEDKKDSLPKSIQDQLPGLRKVVDAAKAGNVGGLLQGIGGQH